MVTPIIAHNAEIAFKIKCNEKRVRVVTTVYVLAGFVRKLKFHNQRISKTIPGTIIETIRRQICSQLCFRRVKLAYSARYITSVYN